ncbi:MAG: DUF1990 domain-containing protein [Anaerolineae bacterium]|jgi:hypothetical protein|nr:DUF1990 domain-containing protein [Anaerolineae bacterium]
MTEPTGQPTTQTSRDEAYWAKPTGTLRVGDVSSSALNLNVEGRQTVGPLMGFGQLWQKTYRIKLGAGIAPEDVVKAWKENLPSLMPPDSRFYPSLAGVAPGEVVLINATLPGLPGGIPVSTGVRIIYADDVSFTVMTPEGHPEAGFNTFSAYEDDGATVAQIQSLGRANDPVYELGYRLMGGAKQQEAIWRHVLGALARRFNVTAPVELEKVVVDNKVQWRYAGNVRHNALIRTVLSAPARWIKGAGKTP